MTVFDFADKHPVWTLVYLLLICLAVPSVRWPSTRQSSVKKGGLRMTDAELDAIETDAKRMPVEFSPSSELDLRSFVRVEFARCVAALRDTRALLATIESNDEVFGIIECFANDRGSHPEAGAAIVSFLRGDCIHWRSELSPECELCGDGAE